MTDREQVIQRFVAYAKSINVGVGTFLRDPNPDLGTLIEGTKNAPITTLHKACGQLWYGDQRPTIILCSYKLYCRIWECIMGPHRSKNEDGSMADVQNFNGAELTWHPHCPRYVVTLINENNTDNIRYRGWVDVEIDGL